MYVVFFGKKLKYILYDTLFLLISVLFLVAIVSNMSAGMDQAESNEMNSTEESEMETVAIDEQSSEQ